MTGRYHRDLHRDDVSGYRSVDLTDTAVSGWLVDLIARCGGQPLDRLMEIGARRGVEAVRIVRLVLRLHVLQRLDYNVASELVTLVSRRRPSWCLRLLAYLNGEIHDEQDQRQHSSCACIVVCLLLGLLIAFAIHLFAR